MKISFLFVMMVIATGIIFPQSISIYKNDQSVLNFDFSDIDSISISAVPASVQNNSSSRGNSADVKNISEIKSAAEINQYNEVEPTVKDNAAILITETMETPKPDEEKEEF